MKCLYGGTRGRKKRKMQLENQSAGNFKSWLWSCYNFFDLFCNGHRIGSLIKLTLSVPDCLPNKVCALTHALKSLPLLELHLLHSCMYTLLCFLGCSAGSWYLPAPKNISVCPQLCPCYSVRSFWSPSLAGPFLTLSSQQVFILRLILWWDLTSWIILLLCLPTYYGYA